MKKRDLKATSSLAIVALVLSACVGLVGEVSGSGTLVTESRDVGGFDRVYLACTGEAVISQNGEESVTLETDDNILEHVITEVREGTLYLEFDTTKVKTISPTSLQFTVNATDLAGVTVAASGDITAESLDVSSLIVKTSAGGNIRLDSLTAEEVEVRLGGSGDVELTGETAYHEILITGSGNLLAEDLRSDAVKIRISGTGDATVWPIDSLAVNLGARGSTYYYGDPPTTEFEDNGTGEIVGLGEK